jgi:cysteine-rich repeat protein
MPFLEKLILNKNEGLKDLMLSAAFFLTFFLFSQTPFASAATSITQYGITWYFDKDYPVGQFANGDWWVVGPVTITRITPDFDGQNNGWEVNPLPGRVQGFDSQCDGFTPSLVPSLPYTTSPGESIVKTVSSGGARPCLQTAAVLTVVGSVPPNSGAGVFRPPYVGTEKPYYFVNDIHTDFLPSYAPVANAPSLEWVKDRFSPLQLDHGMGRMGRFIHPVDSMPNYGADIGKDTGDAALRLMLNDPISQKMPALIAYLQYGIDLYYMVLNGQTWPSGGGHRVGEKLVLAFTAVMFDDEAMKQTVRNADFFEEDTGMYISDKTGKALFGFHISSSDEEDYWSYLRSRSGNRSVADPYQYIDGGVPGEGYQYCCLSQPWKSSALAVYLMPKLQEVWTNPAFFEYVDRWVLEGVHTQPDPCAPVSQGGGPDPSSPVGCVLDPDLAYFNSPTDFACRQGAECGRFPQKHGTLKDGGLRASSFARAMWDAYRDIIETQWKCGNGIVEPGEQCDDGNTTSGDGCSATCQLERSQKSPDFDGNGRVDILDLVHLLQHWGTTDSQTNLDGRGKVDIFDLLLLLQQWGYSTGFADEKAD